MIDVRHKSGDLYVVTIREGGSETQHSVTASAADVARLGNGVPAEAVIDAAFRFLLDREPKETILGRFELMVIARYFPEFERELPGYLTAS